METKIRTSLNKCYTKFFHKNALKVKCLCFLVLLNYCLTAQHTIEWEKNYGGTNTETPYSVQSTTDGGYVVAGISMSFDGDVGGNIGSNDYWILKLDNLGNIQWEKNYGGPDVDNAHSIQQTNDGGYVVAGSTHSKTIDVGGNNGYADYWIIKLDDFGNLQWEKNYGGTRGDWARSIQQTNDGGYIVAGRSESNGGEVGGNNGLLDYWIIKLDETGNLQWEKNYGSTSNDFARSVQQTNDGGYIVAGYTDSNGGDVGGNNGNRDYWIIKLDVLGNLEWEKNYGGSRHDLANSIQLTYDGGYIVAGTSGSTSHDVGGNNGGQDLWIIKLDELGNLEWGKNYGGTGDESANSIQLTNDGGYIVAGTTDPQKIGIDDYWIVKLDELGNLEWEANYGGSKTDIAYSIQLSTDGGYIVAGASKSFDGDVGGNYSEGNIASEGSIRDFWIVKLSGTENFNTTVWPGDLNHDGIVNNQDVGLSGLFLYETGPPRAAEHQNTDWYAHPAEDWNRQQINNEDIKHFDCNGDGAITDNDRQAVEDNMGEMWSTQEPVEPPETSDYQITLHPVEEINQNFLRINVALESVNGGDLTLQGGHFTIDYGMQNQNISNATMNFQSVSWLGVRNLNLTESIQNFQATQTIEIGFTRTDNMDATGNGVIGELVLQLDNSAARLAEQSNCMLNLQIKTIGMHDSQANDQPVENRMLQVNMCESTCENNWYLNNETQFQNEYQSSNLIETEGFLIIGDEQQVEYQSNRVCLQSGFKVKAGASFKAGYGSCD